MERYGGPIWQRLSGFAEVMDFSSGDSLEPGPLDQDIWDATATDRHTHTRTHVRVFNLDLVAFFTGGQGLRLVPL